MRCTGGCCENFTVKDWTGESVAYWKEHGHEYNPPIEPRTQAIIDMLIRLPERENPDTGLGVFTCKNFNPETRDCGIYDSRPKMCRAYPGSGGCQREGCTLSFAPVVGKR